VKIAKNSLKKIYLAMKETKNKLVLFVVQKKQKENFPYLKLKIKKEALV